MKVAQHIIKLKPYEGGKPIEELKRELNIKGKIIKLASNENPLGPSKKAIEAMKTIVDKANLYPDSDSYYLKEKLSKKLGVSRDNIIFGNGSDELIEIIYRTFATGKNDEILYCYPTFIEYKIIGNSFNKKLIELPLKNYSYDIQSLLKAINHNTRIVFLNTPNNPTGTIIRNKDIKSVIKKIPEDCLVVIDEAYHEYAVAEKDYEDIIHFYREGNVIILRTFSKAYGLAGLRIGYGIATPEIVDYMNRVRPPFNVNIIAQHAALAALDDTEHIKNSIDSNLRGKEFLYREFEKMGLKYIKTYANFIIFDVGRDADKVYKQLLNEGIIVRSMSGYGYKTFLRVTIGLPDENKAFIAKLKEILNV